MRVKKYAVLISLLAAIVSVVLAAIAFILSERKCSSYWWQFSFNALLGVFASSIATLFVFIYEYRAERSKAIKELCKTVFSISAELERIPFIMENQDGSIDEKYTKRIRNRSVIEEICDRYIAVSKKGFSFADALEEIDFFWDFDILERIKKRRLRKAGKSESLSAAESKIAKETAKAIYWDEHYSGKRKKIIEKRIFHPLAELHMNISRYALNEFRWYREGQTDQKTEREVTRAILELQSALFEKHENGSWIHKNLPWKHEADKLSKILVGSKLFWLKCEE